MKQLPHSALYIALGIVGLLMIFGWYTTARSLMQPLPQQAKPYLAASIYPLYDLIRNIAGPNNSVKLMQSPGTPVPIDSTSLAGVKYVFVFGHGVDEWAVEAAHQAHIENIVTVDRNSTLLADTDPHYWLSVKNAATIIDTVLDVLKTDDPQHAAEYDQRAVQYKTQLTDLYTYGQTRINTASISSILVDESGWRYIATDYGLSTTTATSSSMMLDPIGGSIDRDTYLSLMKANLNAILK